MGSVYAWHYSAAAEYWRLFSTPEFDQNRDNPNLDRIQPERMQKLSKLLLFAIFAIAARYSQRPETGAQYAVNARALLGMDDLTRRLHDETNSYFRHRIPRESNIDLPGALSTWSSRIRYGYVCVCLPLGSSIDAWLFSFKGGLEEGWLHVGKHIYPNVSAFLNIDVVGFTGMALRMV